MPAPRPTPTLAATLSTAGLPEGEPPVEKPPEPIDPAAMAEMEGEIKRLKLEAVAQQRSGNKPGAMMKLKQAKAVEAKKVAMELGLELGWVQKPLALPLYFSCNGALVEEKQRLLGEISDAGAAVPPRIVGPEVLQRLAQVDARMEELQAQMESGDLTAASWLGQLREAAARDTKLVQALRCIKRNADADAVAGRLRLTEAEAAATAEAVGGEEIDDEEMSAAELAEFEAELGELDSQLMDAADEPEPEPAAMPAATDRVGELERALTQLTQLMQQKEAAMNAAAAALQGGDRARAAHLIDQCDAIKSQLVDMKSAVTGRLTAAVQCELSDARARAAEAMSRPDGRAAAMAALEDGERCQRAINAAEAALQPPQPVAATTVGAEAPAQGGGVPMARTRTAKARKPLTAVQNKQYDDFEAVLMRQAEAAKQHVAEFGHSGQQLAQTFAKKHYEEDMLSLERIRACRAACITKVPKHKYRRQYELESLLRDDQLELEVLEGTGPKHAMYVQAKLCWPDKDRPQTQKTKTSKSGIPTGSVLFTIDRGEVRLTRLTVCGVQCGAARHSSVAQATPLGSSLAADSLHHCVRCVACTLVTQDRKSFMAKLDRRTLVEFDLYQKTWNPLSDPLVGSGHWGQLGGLKGATEMSAEVPMTVGEGRRADTVATLSVVARVGRPLGGGGGGGGGRSYVAFIHAHIF